MRRWFSFCLFGFPFGFGDVCFAFWFCCPVECFGLAFQDRGFLHTVLIMATTSTATIVMMSGAWDQKNEILL